MGHTPFMVQPRVAPKYHAFYWDGLPFPGKGLELWAQECLGFAEAVVEDLTGGRGAVYEGLVCRLLLEGETYFLGAAPCWLVYSTILRAYTITEFHAKFKIAEP